MRMLSLSSEEINSRAQLVSEETRNGDPRLKVLVVNSESAIGGGAGPTAKLQTSVISLTHEQLSAEDIERQLRSANPPVIARILENQVMLDLRTVFPDEEPALIMAVKSLKSD